MGFVHAAVFLLLACISFGKARECTMEDIQPCLQAMGDLSQLSAGGENGPDMTSVCGGLTCVEQLTCDPPAEALAHLKLLDQFKSFCKGAGTGTGAGKCQLSDLQKCSELAAKMKDTTDMNAMCSAMDEIEKCYSDLVSHCEAGVMKSTVEKALDQMKVQRKQMPCSGKGCNITECNNMMTDMVSDQKEPSKACKTAQNVVECYTKEKPNCPENSMIDKVLKEMAPYSSKGCCDVFVKVNEECIKGNEHLLNDTTFQAKDSECQKLEEVFTCTEDKVPNCPKPMMEARETGKKIIKKNLESCETSGYAVTVDYRGGGAGALVPAIAVLASALVASFFTF